MTKRLPTNEELTEHINAANAVTIADLTPTGERVTLNDGKEYTVVQFTVNGLSKSLQRALDFHNGMPLLGTTLVGQTPTRLEDLCPAKTVDEALARRNVIIDLDNYLILKAQ